MSPRRRLGGLVVAVALAYQSLMQVLPHTHHDHETPRYATGCELPGSNSPASHWHAIEGQLPEEPCLACLTRSFFGLAADRSLEIDAKPVAPRRDDLPPTGPRLQQSGFPSPRGPPSSV